MPFKKPDDEIKYVSTESNHPKNVIRKLPGMINKRITNLCSNEEIFNQGKNVYVSALEAAGHKKIRFEYTQEENKNEDKERDGIRKRKRRILWFNPLHNDEVKTRIGATFFFLLQKHFPKTNKLHKLFNKNNVKLSYSCMENIKTIISSTNMAKVMKYRKEKNTQTQNKILKGLTLKHI